MWEQLPALKQELDEFERRMRASFGGQGRRSYLDSLSLGLVDGGGKRLRPALTIAAAHLGEYNREKALTVAVGLETLHTATLVHDDIIDEAALRRGQPTVSAQKGVNTAVFTGDYLFVKSIQMLAAAELPLAKLNEAAQAVEEICLGEVAQFVGRGKVPSFKTYLSRIARKTAVLFAAACSLGAHVAGLEDQYAQAASRFGMYFGIAFQITDDIIDLSGSQRTAGKPVLSDLKEGVITLPILLAAASNDTLRRRVETLYGKGCEADAKELYAIAQDAAVISGLSASQGIRARYLLKAVNMLDRLPDSGGKDMMRGILNLQPQ